MKLNQLVLESAIHDFRSKLNEDINQYLSLALGKIKNKSPEEVFDPKDPKSVSLDQLANVIVSLKILSNSDYRQSMTRRDVGINPNSAKEVFKLLTDIDKEGKDPVYVKKVIKALTALAPTAVQKQRKELEDLKSEDEAIRRKAIQKIEQFLHKVSQSYGKMKASIKN